MCGIAGIINKTSKPFDYSAFCVLGIANDSRGGDSCGVFIDGKYEYGVGKTKLFSNYFLNSDLLYKTKRAEIALLHCRKASVGTVSEKTAQPVVIKNDFGQVEYVLMHNGTIHNYAELAKKYIPEIDITGMTDSQVMAHIFYNVGYEPLNEYNGGAVFAIVDYRGYTPKVLLFKGASKKNKYATTIEEERPLFYCIDKKGRELMFSSIAIHLLALRKDCETFSLKENALVEFNGKGLSVVKYYTRKNVFQQEERKAVTVVTPVYKFDYYDDYPYYNDTYITINHETNTYSFQGKKMHGKYYLSSYGRIEKQAKRNPQNYEAWFFDGVALKNANCFRFLTTLRKDSHLSDTDFFSTFEETIRFLSLDGIFKRADGKWYKASTPLSSVLFTGNYQGITGIMMVTYVNGVKVSTSYNGSYKYIEKVLAKKYDINFKTIREECKSLMKLLKLEEKYLPVKRLS